MGGILRQARRQNRGEECVGVSERFNLGPTLRRTVTAAAVLTCVASIPNKSRA